MINQKKKDLQNRKNWIIKKLLSSENTKEEILNYIAKSDIKDSNEFEDNNEKSLINNIINLKTKNVENIMVPRAEIISIEKQFDKNFDFIKFISINSNKISSVRNYEIKTKNKDKIEKVIDSMNAKFSDITILVVNNQRII